ncbi:hypothetical protein GALMADRAFT_237805 [Galerina marginata CBS 339.88]|uniref:Uncharacterized protein n=1 Tax=Galerina marginata (strain CBS 339.88) TaxID=685588 RepID=A0A067TH95_GALM3|nr:hypothetical protein GALMADRAFT_237805 [Galerina marginata CBS 339.88]
MTAAAVAEATAGIPRRGNEGTNSCPVCCCPSAPVVFEPMRERMRGSSPKLDLLVLLPFPNRGSPSPRSALFVVGHIMTSQADP